MLLEVGRTVKLAHGLPLGARVREDGTVNDPDHEPSLRERACITAHKGLNK